MKFFRKLDTMLNSMALTIQGQKWLMKSFLRFVVVLLACYLSILGIMYLTITGTSAEAGDDGEVGRGNRSNGLITPCRTMSLEAVCGKNPVNHVGKLYNIISTEIAQEIVQRGQGDIVEAQVRLLSQIGRPITDPWVNSIELIPAENVNFESIKKVAEEVSSEKLSKESFIHLRKRLIAGEVQVF